MSEFLNAYTVFSAVDYVSRSTRKPPRLFLRENKYRQTRAVTVPGKSGLINQVGPAAHKWGRLYLARGGIERSSSRLTHLPQ
jgi:hypothetical protein